MKIIEIISKKYGTHQILVDDEDFDRVNQFTWAVNKVNDTFYVKHSVAKSKYNKKAYSIFLHRFIMEENDPKIFIDHIDHNGRNCQKSNLRKCSCSQNGMNRTSNKKASSKYLGVTILVHSSYKKNKYWRATIRINGKNKHLGNFPYTPEGEIQAAKAYDEAAKKYFGEFANLNFK